MKQFFTKINIDSSPGKLTEFTDDVMKELSNSKELISKPVCMKII